MKALTVYSCISLAISSTALPCLAQDFDNAGGPDSGSYTEMKNQLRDMTYTTRLRNSEYDQWQYLTTLRLELENEITAVTGNQQGVQQVRQYCDMGNDSYTCKEAELIIQVDDRMNAAIRNWQNAILVITEIEKNRSSDPDAVSMTRERNRINVLMNDIDRFNERAKEEYHLASLAMVAFQEANPLLFSAAQD